MRKRLNEAAEEDAEASKFAPGSISFLFSKRF